MNRFKGLDLVNSVPEELWMEVLNTAQEGKQTEPSQREGKTRRQGGYLRRVYKQVKKERREKQGRKGKVHPIERRVPKKSTKRQEGLQ